MACMTPGLGHGGNQEASLNQARPPIRTSNVPRNEEVLTTHSSRKNGSSLRLGQIRENGCYRIVGMPLHILLQDCKALNDRHRKDQGSPEYDKHQWHLRHNCCSHHQECEAKCHSEVDLPWHHGIHLSHVGPKSRSDSTAGCGVKVRHGCMQQLLDTVRIETPTCPGRKCTDHENAQNGQQHVQNAQKYENAHVEGACPFTRVSPHSQPPISKAQRCVGQYKEQNHRNQERQSRC
mmetsp:Transcript_126229/g.368855  ORF Transcript_126229/g.368855 Transcript_126229/m.368855 type:complete len:235 (-) Transcript_126229:407-1111(-)